MSLTVPSVTNVQQSVVDQQSAVMKTLVQEYNPDADLKRGVLHDHVLFLSALLSAVLQTNLDRLLASRSLKQIQEDPTLVDDDLVDYILSNWGVTRKEGAAATGTVAIALSEKMAVVVPSGSVFTISGRTFITTEVFAARTSSADVITPNDRLLVQSGSAWVFTITVTDQAVGAAGNVKRGASATPDSPPPKFSSAYVESDFTGGQDDESNAQLLLRLPSGLAAKLWGGRGNIDGLIKYQYVDTQDVSVIGFGDAEMLRDKHAIWPGSTGGRTDIYVRTSKAYLSTTITKTATLLSKVGAVGTWQFTLTREDAPGFYEIEKILTSSMASNAAGFQPASDTRSYDLTDDAKGLLPDITTATEGAYSYFQTSQIQFEDTATDAGGLSLGATASYKVVVRYLPSIKDIQNFLRERTQGGSLSDVLVKAVVPCFVSVSMTVNIPKGITSPDVPTLQQKVSEAINSLGFANKLSASQIAKAVIDYVPTAFVTGISIVGRLRRPDGTTLNLVSADSITLPSEASKMVTNRTTAFICASTDVAATVSVVDSPSV